MSFRPRRVFSPSAFEYTFTRRVYGGPTPRRKIGPVSMNFHEAQIFWAEIRLWEVYDQLRAYDVGLHRHLATFSVRLTFSWYIGWYALDWPAEAILRRIRNDFFLKRHDRPTLKEQRDWCCYLCNVQREVPKSVPEAYLSEE